MKLNPVVIGIGALAAFGVAYAASSASASTLPDLPKLPTGPSKTDDDEPPVLTGPDRVRALQRSLNTFRTSVMEAQREVGILQPIDPFIHTWKCRRDGALVVDGIHGVCTDAATYIATEILIATGWVPNNVSRDQAMIALDGVNQEIARGKPKGPLAVALAAMVDDGYYERSRGQTPG